MVDVVVVLASFDVASFEVDNWDLDGGAFVTIWGDKDGMNGVWEIEQEVSDVIMQGVWIVVHFVLEMKWYDGTM